MNTIFREVLIKERLPKKSGEYYTDKGKIIFGTNTDKFQASKEYYPQYWLEEVDLPTDEKIESKFLINDYMIPKADKLLSIGAKWMRDFVLAVTPNKLQK